MRLWVKKGVAVVCTAALAIGLVACGGSASDGSGPDPTEAPTEAPTEEPLLTSEFASAEPGSVIEFGSYRQTDRKGPAEPIEWIVLANEGSKLFVVSKYVLDSSYGLGTIRAAIAKGEWNLDPVPEENEVITWEISEVRRWLNEDFYEKAFSKGEKECIVETEVRTGNTRTPDETYFFYNTFINTPDLGKVGTMKTGNCYYRFETYGGEDTKDFLFLLSYQEAQKYLEPLGRLGAQPTTASGVERDSVTGYASYILRSPGYPSTHLAKRSLGSVDLNKTVYSGYALCFRVCDGETLETFHTKEFPAFGGEKTIWELPETSGKEGIRPAMWLKIK